MKEFVKISKSMFQDFKGYYKEIIGLFFLSFTTVAISLFIAIINQTTIDQVFYAKNINYLFHFMIYVFIGIYILSISLNITNSYITSKVYSKIDSIFKTKYYEKILYSSFHFHSSHNSSDIYYRMFKDLSYVVEYYLNLLITLPTNIIYAICAIALMFYWSNVLSFIFLGILIINVIVINLIKSPIYKINSNQRVIEQNLIVKITNDISKILTIKVFGIEKFQINKMKRNFNDYVKANVKNKFLLSMLTVCANLSTQIWSLLLVVIGAILVYRGHLTVGEFISFSGVASATSSVTSQIINTVFNYQIAKLSYNRFNEYNNQIDNQEHGGYKKFELDEGLFVNNLTYKYPNSDNNILSNLNLNAITGQIVAIIGENGKGKTTLINLIDRLLTPQNGFIMIDSENINKIAYEEFRKNVGYVLQRPVIFDTSIRDNIVLNQTDIPTEKIIDVLNNLGMYDDIKCLPKELETIIGENGYQLSIGNLQKIALARVFVRDYKILILDEPTSSLDIESQKKFIDMVNKYKVEKRAVILLVSHTESEIQMADAKFYM